MTKRILISISLIITGIPFVLLSIYYDCLPDQIAVFVDINGSPTMLMDKSIFSVFRLPVMGVMTQIICFTMYRIKLEYEREKNQRLWLSVSVLAALKMSLTSIEVLIYTKQDLFNLIRITVLIVIFLAIVSIAFNLYSIYNRYNKHFMEYFSKVQPSHKILLFLSFTFYLLLVIFPLIG
ncbi:MAG: DUF1648 domain-containing protein [Sporocytophaga sp.]|nr:DUF1648 domain-containing protein [Sporocytophaga sp.]